MTDRVRLNLRVGDKVQNAYESAILEKYPQKRPYAGTELEAELRRRLDEGERGGLYESVEALFGKMNLDGPQKENQQIPSSDNRSPVQYQIDPDVKNGIKALTEQKSTVRSAGQFVELVMWDYAVNGSTLEQVTERVNRIKEEFEEQSNNENLGPTERRAEIIIDHLQNGQFTLNDFEEAVKQTPVISPGKHVLKNYLPEVLDRMEYTTHPNNSKIFVDPDEVDMPNTHDPRNKMYLLMTEKEKRTVIKLEAYSKVKNASQRKVKFAASEAVTALDGRPRQKTVRPLMKQIADFSPGFQYEKDESQLSLNQDKIEEDDVSNSLILDIYSNNPP